MLALFVDEMATYALWTTDDDDTIRVVLRSVITSRKDA